jgi:hypothetical protein
VPAAAASVEPSNGDVPPVPTSRDWTALVERAVGSDHEHEVKLVHSCLEEARAHGRDGPRHRAAERALR